MIFDDIITSMKQCIKQQQEEKPKEPKPEIKSTDPVITGGYTPDTNQFSIKKG
jgi:hypothetical protein